MALIQCPECRTDISDKAGSCPKCGHPMKEVPGHSQKNGIVSIVRNVLMSIVLLVVVVGGWKFVHKVNRDISKPAMPIEVKYRKALLADGLVGIFKNTSNRQLAVVATFTNPTLKITKSFRLDLSPGGTKEIGHMEGWNFESGDTITLTHNDYATMKVRFQ